MAEFENDREGDVQRTLGRIEGTQGQILAELKSLRQDFGDHKNEDQVNFSDMRASLYKEVGAQQKQIGQLKQDADRAKGAGWAILALLGGLASFVGGAVLAVLQGWITVKFH